MNIIFLDIDGVLNCNNCFYVDQNHISTPCIRFFLESLHIISNVKVVISSSWRTSSLKGFKNMALEMGGKENGQYIKELFTFFHTDWATPKLNKKRGIEVKEWLKLHPVDKYLCIDDDNDYLQSQPVLNTNIQYGFGHLEYLITNKYFLNSDKIDTNYIKECNKAIIKKMKSQIKFLNKLEAI